MRKLPVTLTPTEQTLAFGYWALQLLVIPAAVDLIFPFFGISMAPAHLNLLYSSLNAVCLCTVMHRFLIQSIRLLPDQGKHPFLMALVAFAAYWICALLFHTVYLRLFPDFQNPNDQAILQMAGSHYTVTAIVTVLLVPITEELIFRGLIFGTLHPYNRFAAYALSALAFAAIHVASYAHTYSALMLLLSFIRYLPAGLFLCWAYERSGSIFAPLAAHIAVNQITLLILR